MAGIGITEIVFGGLIEELKMKPWWEKFRGYALAVGFIASFSMTFILQISVTITCVPEEVESLVGKNINYPVSVATHVNNYCSSKMGLGIQEVGLINMLAAFFILCVASSWYYRPHIVASFQTFHQVTDMLDTVVPPIEGLRSLLIPVQPMEESDDEVTRKLKRGRNLIWSYKNSGRQVHQIYFRRNLALLGALLAALVGVLSTVFLVGKPEDGYSIREINNGEFNYHCCKASPNQLKQFGDDFMTRKIINGTLDNCDQQEQSCKTNAGTFSCYCKDLPNQPEQSEDDFTPCEINNDRFKCYHNLKRLVIPYAITHVCFIVAQAVCTGIGMSKMSQTQQTQELQNFTMKGQNMVSWLNFMKVFLQNSQSRRFGNISEFCDLVVKDCLEDIFDKIKGMSIDASNKSMIRVFCSLKTCNDHVKELLQLAASGTCECEEHESPGKNCCEKNMYKIVARAMKNTEVMKWDANITKLFEWTFDNKNWELFIGILEMASNSPSLKNEEDGFFKEFFRGRALGSHDLEGSLLHHNAKAKEKPGRLADERIQECIRRNLVKSKRKKKWRPIRSRLSRPRRPSRSSEDDSDGDSLIEAR